MKLFCLKSEQDITQAMLFGRMLVIILKCQARHLIFKRNLDHLKIYIVATIKGFLNKGIFLSSVVVVVFVALRPMSAMVIAGRSVHLTTLLPGQA